MRTGRRRYWLIPVAALIGGALLWLSADAAVPAHATAPERRGEQVAAAMAKGSELSVRGQLARELLKTAAQHGTSHESAQADERPADGRPHPITLEHRRLYRDVDLLRAADEAIQAEEYQAARELLAQHHRELPGMSQVEEEGLLLLTDCRELRSASNVQRVQQFYDLHTDSSVRRRLRRACLEPD